MADFINCTVELRGTSPYSQSRMHDDPWLEGESADAYDQRTWRSRLNTTMLKGSSKVVVVPAMAFQRGLTEGAKFSKKKIQGEGKSTWTKRFESGVMVMGDGVLLDGDGKPVMADQVKPIVLSLNSDGKRGSGSRVIKRLPQIPAPWSVTFQVVILDAMIIEAIFVEMTTSAGLFIGMGQFRPEKGGNNGRYIVERLQWEDNRQTVSRRRAA